MKKVYLIILFSLYVSISFAWTVEDLRKELEKQRKYEVRRIEAKVKYLKKKNNCVMLVLPDVTWRNDPNYYYRGSYRGEKNL